MSPLETTLCRLSDPERPAEPVNADMLGPVLTLGRAHGVLAVLLRKLGPQLDPTTSAAVRQEVTDRVGPMLHLRSIWAELRTLVAAGLPALVVKGPDLADAVYPIRGDRPFGDLDIVAPIDAHDRIAAFLGGHGYRLFRKRLLDHTDANLEQKWVHRDIPSVLVEVHGNLVHYPALRQRVSFGYAEILRCQAVSPRIARLLTVVAHASLGHKLHELKLLVDVLQTFRRLDDKDRQELPALARDLRLGLEASLCLGLAAQLFDEPGALEMANRIDSRRRPYLHLVNARTVLSFPQSRRAVSRHHFFRAFQYMVPR